MDQDLKQYLDTKFTAASAEVGKLSVEVGARFSEFDKRFGEIDKRFAEVDKRFAQMELLFTEERAALRQTETNLLTAFHNWARTHELRSRAVSAAVLGFDERLGLLEDRLAEVERKQAS